MSDFADTIKADAEQTIKGLAGTLRDNLDALYKPRVDMYLTLMQEITADPAVPVDRKIEALRHAASGLALLANRAQIESLRQSVQTGLAFAFRTMFTVLAAV